MRALNGVDRLLHAKDENSDEKRKNGAARIVVPIENSCIDGGKHPVRNQLTTVHSVTATNSDAQSARTNRCRTKPKIA